MKNRVIVLVVVLALSVLAVPVAAQENNSSANLDQEKSDEIAMPGDPGLTILDYWHADGTFYVKLKTGKMPRSVTVAAAPEGSGEVATGRATRVFLNPRTERVVSVSTSKAKVWLSSSESMENGYFLELSSGAPIIGGPFSPGETRIVGITALATGIGMVGVNWFRKRDKSLTDSERVF